MIDLLKDRCGGQLGDSGEGDSSTLQNDGTNPTLTSVLEELRKVQEKLDHSVETQNVLMTTIIKWVSGIEGRLSMLDGGKSKIDLPYGAPFYKLTEKIEQTESRLNTCRKRMRESNEELTSKIRRVEGDVDVIINGVEQNEVDGHEEMEKIREKIDNNINRIEKNIKAMERKVNGLPTTSTTRRKRRSTCHAEHSKISSSTEWRRRCLAEVKCTTFKEHCFMKCRFCGYDYRGKSVTVNAHISHLKVKHHFVASNVTTENDGEEYLPQLIRIGVEQKQRESPLSLAEERREKILIQNQQRNERAGRRQISL